MGRKYALIKKYALKKHVCLLTRIYSIAETRIMFNKGVVGGAEKGGGGVKNSL